MYFFFLSKSKLNFPITTILDLKNFIDFEENFCFVLGFVSKHSLYFFNKL